MSSEKIMFRKGSVDAYYSQTPILRITKELFATETLNCRKIYYESQHWFIGKGVRPEQHPGKNELRVLEQHLPETYCGHCNSKNVFVIALQGNVAGHSGDAYYDYEIICRECKYFSSFSYAEN